MTNACYYSQEDEPETLIKIIKEFMLENNNIELVSFIKFVLRMNGTKK